MHPVRPPKFKVLVAHIVGASDPSRFGGNAQVSASYFELQTSYNPNGTGRVTGPAVAPAAPSSSNYTACIKILSNTYWNPTEDAPPPFFSQEEVQVGDTFLTSGEDFGVNMGGGVGTPTQIATSLALAISRIPGVSAVSTGEFVYILSRLAEGFLPIMASNDTAELFSGYTFEVRGPGGEILTVAPNDRRTYYVLNTVRTSTPPVIGGGDQ